MSSAVLQDAELAARDAPAITLADVEAMFSKWLYLPDMGAIHVVLGTVAANHLPGDPVWLLLVGPPGGSKTETIQSISQLESVHSAATLTEPALLSGTPKRDRAKDATGGLLRSVSEFGIIICKDFGSILSMHREQRGQVLAALREVYDGSWSRLVGTDGGKVLEWKGKAGLIAGCTPVIDRHHQVMGSMGERFVLYRMPKSEDSSQQARRALSHHGTETQMRAELAAAVASLFREGVRPAQPRSPEDDDRLIALSVLVVRCRSAVERDRHTREVELIPDSEAPTRLVKQLDRLLIWRCRLSSGRRHRPVSDGLRCWR